MLLIMRTYLDLIYAGVSVEMEAALLPFSLRTFLFHWTHVSKNVLPNTHFVEPRSHDIESIYVPPPNAPCSI